MYICGEGNQGQTSRAVVIHNNNNSNNNNNRNTAHVECKNKGDTSNNWGDWNHFQIFRKYVSDIPGNHDVKELQKTAILDTAHILRKVLT
jgi:hypothetical protein